MKTLYIVRHCKSEGQQADAPLTAEGLAQSERLSDLLADAHIERIISSPYVRAKDSIVPLSKRLNLQIELDTRLVERVLCAGFNNWQKHLETSFQNLDFCLAGGESSRAAMQRIVSVVEDIQCHSSQITLLVTHGNLMALLLKYFDNAVGFTEWQNLTNLDVYRINLTQPPQVQRL